MTIKEFAEFKEEVNSYMEKLSFHIKARKFTLNEFAEKIGCSVRTLQYKIKNPSNITLKLALNIVKAFKDYDEVCRKDRVHREEESMGVLNDTL